MSAAVLIAVAAWAWGWGWWAHDGSRVEILISVAWPILVPLGKTYQWWRFGHARRRYVYSNTRWWQRGDLTRRPDDWNARGG